MGFRFLRIARIVIRLCAQEIRVVGQFFSGLARLENAVRVALGEAVQQRLGSLIGSRRVVGPGGQKIRIVGQFLTCLSSQPQVVRSFRKAPVS